MKAKQLLILALTGILTVSNTLSAFAGDEYVDSWRKAKNGELTDDELSDIFFKWDSNVYDKSFVSLARPIFNKWAGFFEIVEEDEDHDEDVTFEKSLFFDDLKYENNGDGYRELANDLFDLDGVSELIEGRISELKNLNE